MTVSFTTTAPEQAQITRIAKRWMAMLRASNMRPSYDIIDVRMDLSAIVAQGQMTLDLTMLERSDEFDFLHDMAGIHRHMDRTTGLLMDHFIPRAARGREVLS
jgi:hypothetical protein